MATDRSDVTILPPSASWVLLRSRDVGRLAVSVADQPDMFSINYMVDHGRIVFRTAEGTKLAAALLGHAVALEVGGHDSETGEAGPKHRLVEVVPGDISGRRFPIVGRTPGRIPRRSPVRDSSSAAEHELA